MTNDGSNTLVYDAENRAVSATNGANSGTYTYDGNGLRVKKISGSTATVYLFSGSKVIAEYDNGAAVGSPSREYIYLGAVLLAKIDSSGTHYYHADHLSNRLVTDSSGNSFAQMGHFPYGEPWYNASNDKLFFTTYERDAESGNDYAMARYDVSRLGRFSSPDPLAGSTGDPQSLDLYDYVVDDPTDLEDPSGLCPNRAPFGRNGKLICGVAGTGRKFLEYLIYWDPTAVFQLGGPEGPYLTYPTTCILNANCRIIGPVFSAPASGGNNSPSPIWAAIKTFFTTLPSTDPGSCIDVALNIARGPLEAAKKVAENADKYAKGAANGLAGGAMVVSTGLNQMLRANQLDPFLGPAVAAGATIVAAGLNYVAAGVARAAPYIGEGFVATADAVILVGVVREGYAAATGKCHP